jgi:hypothetical protein
MRALVSLLSLPIIAVCAVTPSVLEAQAACAEGRERDGTGRCCWPAQHYSVAHARCEGVPACPDGFVEHGDDCVARAGAVLPYPPAAPPTSPETTEAPEPEVLEAATYPSIDAPDVDASAVPAPPTTTPDHVTGYLPRGYESGIRATPTSWPLFGEIGRAHARRPVQSVGTDSGLLFLSMTMHGFGWILGWLVPIIDEASGACATAASWMPGAVRQPCNSWPLAFIPIVGSFISGLSNFGSPRWNSGWAFGIGIPSMLLQTAGLISLIVSLANSTTDYRFEPLEAELGGAALSLSFDAPGSDAGASLAVRF